METNPEYDQFALRIKNNFLQLKNFLDIDDINRFIEIALKIYCELERTDRSFECAYIISNKENDYEELLNTSNTKRSVIYAKEEIERLEEEKPLSLSLIHNHPDKTAPSYSDFEFLMHFDSIKNMIVFDVIGNLYFVQKTHPFIYSAINNRKEEIRNLSDKLLHTILIKNLMDEYPDLEIEKSIERISKDNEKQNEILKLTTHEYFLLICKSYDFNYYPRS